jgi:PAS domain S-box-containing protein
MESFVHLRENAGYLIRLLVEQARFRAIIDEASDAIQIVDAEIGRIIETNQKACELSGSTRNAMIGRAIREVWPTERFEGDFSRADGMAYRRRDGSLLIVDATRRTVTYGGRRYQIIVFWDALDRLARESAQQESAALRSVTELANAAAHEINNALTALLGSLDLLSRRLAAESNEAVWVRRAREAGERIRDIVTRMRQITRLERAEPVAGVAMLDLRKSGEAEPPPPHKPDVSADS